jgi:type III restriction enzyme
MISPTVKSHINAVVWDSTWEPEAAKMLDESDVVKCYARNDHLGLAIKYEYMGIDHDYEPDFIVRLANDLNLLLEIKGFDVHDKEKTSAKHNAARRWVTAVNNQGEFGRWDFLVCWELDDLLPQLQELGR